MLLTMFAIKPYSMRDIEYGLVATRKSSCGYPAEGVFPRGQSTLSEDKVRVRGLSEDGSLVGKAHGAEQREKQPSVRHKLFGQQPVKM